MKKSARDFDKFENGFAHIILFLIIILVVLGVAGYFIFNLSDKFFPKTGSSSLVPKAATQIDPAADIRGGGSLPGPSTSGSSSSGGGVGNNQTTATPTPDPGGLQLADPDKWPG